MPQRIRLGTVTSGTLDTLEGTIEIDNGDIYIVAENGDIRTDGNLTFEDSTADPSANGELQRNGADLKAFSGGAVRNLSDIGGLSTATIDDTDSPYTTSDEDVIYVDESGGAVMVELATADATLGNEIEVVNLTGTNTVTVSTEGSETIDPDGDSSKAITKAGWAVGFVSDGTDWTAGVTGEFESVTVESLAIGGTLYEEDGEIDVTGESSVTYSVNGTFDEIIIIPKSGDTGNMVGYDQLRVNNDSGDNYNYLNNADSQTTGQSEFGDLPRSHRIDYIKIADNRGDRIGLAVVGKHAETGKTVGGENGNISGPITQFAFLDASGTNRDLEARVLGRQT